MFADYTLFGILGYNTHFLAPRSPITIRICIVSFRHLIFSFCELFGWTPISCCEKLICSSIGCKHFPLKLLRKTYLQATGVGLQIRLMIGQEISQNVPILTKWSSHFNTSFSSSPKHCLELSHIQNGTTHWFFPLRYRMHKGEGGGQPLPNL